MDLTRTNCLLGSINGSFIPVTTNTELLTYQWQQKNYLFIGGVIKMIEKIGARVFKEEINAVFLWIHTEHLI